MTQRPLIKMNSNENYFLDEEWMRNLVKEALNLIDIRRYPIIYENDTKKAIAEFHGINPENIVLGNGSDEVIDCTLKALLTAGDNIIINSPTFGMYKFYTRLISGIVKEVSLKEDFNMDIPAIMSAIDARTKMVVVCSPNNPTGNQFPIEDVKEVIEKSNTPVVVDEAYADLARYSVLGLINDHPNLIVFKTFSKSFGLAGIRVGYGISNTNNIEKIKKTIPPFNVNSVALATVRVILEHQDYINKKAQEIRAERENFYQALSKIRGLKPYPTETNFILVKVSPEYDAQEIVKKLEQQNILIRYWGFEPLLKNCVRISLGNPEMNQTLINALEEITEGKA